MGYAHLVTPPNGEIVGTIWNPLIGGLRSVIRIETYGYHPESAHGPEIGSGEGIFPLSPEKYVQGTVPDPETVLLWESARAQEKVPALAIGRSYHGQQGKFPASLVRM